MLVVCWGVVHALASDMGATMEAAERRLASGLAETTLEELVRNSDVVVVGTIVEERRHEVFLLPPVPNTISVWRVRVEETVSGLVENGTVDVVFREDWFSGMAGRTVLVFGRQMPLPVGQGWQGVEEPTVVLNDLLVPTEYGALFLCRDEGEGYWGPSVGHVPWLPARSERSGATWPDFLQRVQDAARQSGARGHTVPGAYRPSVFEDEGRTARVIAKLDRGPFALPDEAPPAPDRPGVSSGPLRIGATELQEAKHAFGAPAREGTRYVPERLTLLHLHAQVTAYHMALVAKASSHAGEVRALDMRLLGLIGGGPLSVKHVRDVACDAAKLPRDCTPSAFPTCGTHDRLRECAEALCEDPAGHRDPVCSHPEDFGLDGQGWCAQYQLRTPAYRFE